MASIGSPLRIVIYQLVESVFFALNSLRVNLMRTSLSLLGVSVGIFLIIAVFSAADSMERDISQSMDMISDDMIFVQKRPFGPEEGDEEYAWWKYESRTEPNLENFYQLESLLDVAGAMAFQTAEGKTVEYKNSSVQGAFMIGGSHEYDKVFPLKIEKGRYFTQDESDGGRNVGIIGYEVAQSLFGDELVIGRSIKVGGLKVDVIGTFEKEGASLMQNGFDRAVLVPVRFATRLIDVRHQPNNSITIKPIEGVSVEMLKDETIAAFRGVRKLKPRQDNDFSVIEATMIGDAMDQIFGVLNGVSILLGSFALLVGGFGILNIMFVSVHERTPLIGVQKSLGAKNYFILGEFIFESVFLCILGGLIGLLLVFLIFSILNAFIDGFTFALSSGNIVTGVIISSIIGLLAGFLPALRASRMDPVEAMRA